MILGRELSMRLSQYGDLPVTLEIIMRNGGIVRASVVSTDYVASRLATDMPRQDDTQATIRVVGWEQPGL